MSGPYYIRVAINRPLAALFDYTCPATLNVGVGQRVRVPFGRRREIGIVVECDCVPAIAPERIRPLDAVLDTQPVLSAAVLDLLRFAADYYHHPLGETLLNALPPALRKGAALPDLFAPVRHWRHCPTPASRRLGSRQQVIVQALAQNGQALDLASLGALTGLHLRQDELERLQALGQIEVHEIVPQRVHGIVSAQAMPALTTDQQAAVQCINAVRGERRVFLLDGVTGSGKTEVYLQAAAQRLLWDEQVLILVPEIALTPQTVQRFEQRFPGQVVALHSAMAEGERLRAWARAHCGMQSVILGTRSALFTPLPRLGLIVVDEEHDTAYKQQDGLRYHARDLAVMRGHLESIPVVLGSATPTLESLAKAQQGRYTALRLTTRPDGSQPPRIQFVNTQVHRTDEGLSRPLLDRMQRVLDQGLQCFILLNRRGFARVLSCGACGWVADCPHCDAHLTVHLSQRQVICHLCGYQAALVTDCSRCAVPLGHAGVGTQRLEAALRQHFPTLPLLRLDRDTVQNRGALERCLDTIRAWEAGIVVGTQMLAKGHDFPRVGLVGVIDVDQGLYSPDLRAPEHTLQLVVQAAGRAGRAGASGEVWVQTGHPEHPVMQALQTGDYRRMVAPLLRERQQGRLPPFGHVGLLRIEGATPEATTLYASRLAEQLRHAHPEVRVLGPAPAPRYRVNQRYREQIFVSSHQRGCLHSVLDLAQAWQRSDPPSRDVRCIIDVDPLSLS